MNSPLIAIIGMACHYPGAQDLRTFWENILTKRRQFRPLPNTRLPKADYYDSDPSAPDKTYCYKAGLIDGLDFDPVQYRIPRSTFDSADIVHWLALKVALASLEDAELSQKSMPKERTGVILGNTLTGEHSRAEGLRLRWPFVRRVLEKSAIEKGLSSNKIIDLLDTAEGYYKSIFTPITEDSLAGALSNTIAGRICNYLDLHGGGYTVDGACSSSVIAAATAATQLVNRDLDLALAGGVDISLDTFELVGFAKTAALATEDMRVYDRRANGFIPGEGCGFVVMKRLEDAVADGDYVYAVLHGWGISSDGKGGLTAPNAQGQSKALLRAYERAGWDINELDFIEGHGTGTAVGDKTELGGIALAMDAMGDRDEESLGLRRCGVTSLKSLIGHTKAASGVGALIKTVIALNQRVLPPIANCFAPNPVFAERATGLYPLLHGEIRSSQDTLRAGVSGMGFGGINSHLALASGDPPAQKIMPAIDEKKLLADFQRTELFVLSASTVEELLERVQLIEVLVQNICEGEQADLAAHLAMLYGQGQECGSVRAAVTAESPERLLKGLAEMGHILRTTPPQDNQTFFHSPSGCYLGNNAQSHRVGFLFPGQGSQKINMGRQLVQRHDWAAGIVKAVEDILGWSEKKQLRDIIFRPLERALHSAQVREWKDQLKQTENAQPALCLASVLRLEQLNRLGIHPDAVGGHSLGELTAFYAAGAYSKEVLIQFAALRGQAMAPGLDTAGAMASLSCSAQQAQELLDMGAGYGVVANKNSPSQTVISGEVACVERVCRRAEERGIRAVILPVANAFHSRFVSQAAQVLAESDLLPERPKQLTTALFTGMQGRGIGLDCDLRRHFADQVVSPVDFIGLVQKMSKACDMLVEVGPGRVLTGLTRNVLGMENTQNTPSCFPLETEAGQERDLNRFLAAYFVRGGAINWDALYEERLIRPFIPAHERIFLTNPCERSFSDEKENSSSAASSLRLQQLQGEKGTGVVSRLLAEAAGISEEKLFSYLEQRSQFLGGLIKVDLDNMPSLGEKYLPPSSEATLTLIPTLPLPPATERKTAQHDVALRDEKKSTLHLLFSLVEERTGFPLETLSADLRLLDDLNLDSIKASELIAEAANRAGLVAATLNVAEYANATLQELATLLDREPGQQPHDEVGEYTSKYPSWVRDFVMQYLSDPLPTGRKEDTHRFLQGQEVLVLFEAGQRDVVTQLELVLGECSITVQFISFTEARQTASLLLERFGTVIALLPHQEPGEILYQQALFEYVDRLHTLFSSSFYAKEAEEKALVIVQFGDGFFGDGPVAANITSCSAKALGASLHLEHPQLKVRVLDISPVISSAEVCRYIFEELTTAASYVAAGYAADQIRRIPQPVLRNIAADRPRSIRWSSKDVVLATGGAKGITAECVLALARATGVQLALVGSSSMRNEQHDEIFYTLKRATEAGLSAHYYQCDITDAEAVQRLVLQVEKEQGQITGVIHGSALNKPGALRNVSMERALEEMSPKVIGAMNLCAALRDHPPRLFLAFSSIIGISGMQQNGWYGFSNETLHLFLRQYGHSEPRTSTLSIAFSIWDEVGMGIRMGSTSWLSQIGVEALSVQQGTARFLQLATQSPAVDQVIVTARVTGLDTFFTHQPPFPEDLRFIDKVTGLQPGVEIVSRTKLTLEEDSYIRDHCWRGTYLFPMVFGLEAMAQAVRTVTGITNFDAVCIEDIELARPISITEDFGAEIEIHALVLEQNEQGDLEADCRVQVQIRTEQTNFSVDHFSATFVLRKDCPSVQYTLPEQFSALDLNPEEDLYKEELLFQGASFQKIDQVFQLTSENCLFSIAQSPPASIDESGEQWILGNPFFRDALLQSGQLPVPQDLCLPAYIERIERFSAESHREKSVLGKVIVEEHTEKYIYGTVTAFTQQGWVLEQIIGYRAQIIEHRQENPTAEDLVYPGVRDRRILLNELKQREALLPNYCVIPRFSLEFIPHLQHIGREKRRKKELPFIRESLMPFLESPHTRVEISWSKEGKPFLAIPTDAGINFSLSHNQGTIICTAGEAMQGCDFETVVNRSKGEWLSLLGEESYGLLTNLTEQGDRLDRAGTRIWCTFEALFKALQVRPDVGMIRIAEMQGEAVLFIYGNFCILTFPVQLTLRGERMLAVMVPEKCRKKASSDKVPVSENMETWPNRVGSFTHEFTTTFLEGRGPKGKVYFTNIPVWMGELRELALLPIAELLVQDMKSRQWGMVTNRSFFTVDQQLDSYDTVIGEVRLLEDTDLSRSFLSLAFKWFKKQEDGSLVRAISGKLATTWVKVLGHGNVQPADLPGYFKAYLEKLSPSQDDCETPGRHRHPLFSKTTPLFLATVSTRKESMLFQQKFLTSQEDSNLVGNIYFSNYYKWQARVRDHYLETNLPVISSQDLNGDFVCVHAEVHHLQEAVPFEVVEVSMYLYKVFAEGFVVYFEYHTVDEQGQPIRKLAHGQHGAVWASGGGKFTGEIYPERMPEEYLAHFMKRAEEIA